MGNCVRFQQLFQRIIPHPIIPQTFILQSVIICQSSLSVNQLQIKLKYSDQSFLGLKEYHELQNKLYEVYDFIESNLKQEILERNKNMFEEKQLWSILCSVALGLKNIYKFKKGHGFVSPINIYIDQNGIVKIADPKISSTNEHTNQAFYYAPQILQIMKIQSFQYQIDPIKADIYSLAICILNAATLSFNQDIYDYQNFQINYEILQQKLLQVCQKYSQSLATILASMLIQSVQDRPNLEELQDAFKKMIQNQSIYLPAQLLIKDQPDSGNIYKMIQNEAKLQPDDVDIIRQQCNTIMNTGKLLQEQLIDRYLELNNTIYQENQQKKCETVIKIQQQSYRNITSQYQSQQIIKGSNFMESFNKINNNVSYDKISLNKQSIFHILLKNEKMSISNSTQLFNYKIQKEHKKNIDNTLVQCNNIQQKNQSKITQSIIVSQKELKNITNKQNIRIKQKQSKQLEFNKEFIQPIKNYLNKQNQKNKIKFSQYIIQNNNLKLKSDSFEAWNYKYQPKQGQLFTDPKLLELLRKDIQRIVKKSRVQ